MNIQLNNSRVALFSDLHLGVHQDSENWHQIAREWVLDFKADLERNNIKDIIFCGDFFHVRAEVAVNTLHFASEFLEILKDFNIICIVGNHDAYYKDRSDVNSLSILKNHENMTIVEEQAVFEAFGKKIVMCPWGVDESRIPECDLLFGHFEIANFRFNQYKVCEHGLKASDLLSKSKLVISGHLHQRQDREYRDGRILYLGNPFQMDFGDVNGVKGHYLMDLTDFSMAFRENKVSPVHHKIKLSELVAIGEINKDLKKTFKGNFIKLVVDRRVSPDDMDRLIRLYQSFKPRSLIIDYQVNFNQFGDGFEMGDLSGIDIGSAIKEFVNLLEIENKEIIIDHTVDLFHRCQND